MIPDPASVKDETSHAASDSGLPGRFRLIGFLAPSGFEKARIDLVGGAAIRLASRLNCPTGAGCTRRGARGWVMPQVAVLEDLANDVALACFDVEDPTQAGRR